jgi:hypothetical protein
MDVSMVLGVFDSDVSAAKGGGAGAALSLALALTVSPLYQRRCGAVGVHLRWHRQLSKSKGSVASYIAGIACVYRVDSSACVYL